MIHHNYSQRSNEKLDTTHPIIQRTMRKVIKISTLDIGITSGRRFDKEQHQLYLEGKSTLDGYNKLSMHQPFHPGDEDKPELSKAVDFSVYPAPYSGDTKDLERYAVVWGIIQAVANNECQLYFNKTGIRYQPIWGRDWDGDGNLKDQKFDDPYHWELKRV
jgi:hypothetical protein